MSNETWLRLFRINWKRHPKVRARAGSANAVLAIGALLLASPMAKAQDVVPSEQEPSSGAAQGGNGGNGGNPFSDRYVITFSPGTDHSGRAEAAQNAGVQVRHNSNFANAATVIIPNENALNALRNNRSVVSVSPEGVMYLFAKKPSAPTSLTAGVNMSDVDLTWTDNSSGNGQEGGFEIQRCSGPGCGSFSTVFTTAPDVTAFNDPGLPADSYSYRVRATNSGNGPSSPWSNTDTVVVGGGGGSPPAAPTSLGAGSTSDTSVSVGWVDNAGNETNFEIERCTGGGCNTFSQIAIVAADVVLYSDTGLSASTAYRYRVRAINGDGNSAYSNTADVTTASEPGPPLPPPPNERGTSQQPPDGVIRVGIPTAASNGLGIGVAVVDTGIYFDHEDLDPAPDVPAFQTVPGVYNDGTSYNGSNEGQSATDLWGHGTHVAGRIAALDNNYGTLGVAPHATLYSVKVDATPAGQIATTDIIAGLEWIIAKGPTLSPPIRVVNISSGGPFEDPIIDQMYHDRIIDLYNMDIVVVVSAGNTSTVEVSSLMPAAWPETITVAATIASEGLAACAGFGIPKVLPDTATSFTTDGTDVDISAPGAERTDAIGGCTGFFYGTLSTTSPANEPPAPDEVNGTYGRKIPSPGGWLEARGTSFSAPLVAGVVARILQANPVLDVTGVRSQIGALADRVGEVPLDHPWNGSFGVTYTYDGEREGIAQAPPDPVIP